MSGPARAIQMRSSRSAGERNHSMNGSNGVGTNGVLRGMSRSASPLVRQSFVYFSGSRSSASVSTRMSAARMRSRDSAAMRSRWARCFTRSSSQNRSRRSSR